MESKDVRKNAEFFGTANLLAVVAGTLAFANLALNSRSICLIVSLISVVLAVSFVAHFFTFRTWYSPFLVVVWLVWAILFGNAAMIMPN